MGKGSFQPSHRAHREPVCARVHLRDPLSFLQPSLTVCFTKLLTNGFRSSFDIPEVCFQLGNFISTCQSKNLEMKLNEFHAELCCEVNKFIAREVRAIR